MALIYFCRTAVVVLCGALPSTISSESSVKNSLSGGLLGLFRVLSSCWILVDTLLLTGTPEERHACSHATWPGLFTAPQHYTSLLAIPESAALHSRRNTTFFVLFWVFKV